MADVQGRGYNEVFGQATSGSQNQEHNDGSLHLLNNCVNKSQTLTSEEKTMSLMQSTATPN
jgi:hypothetical protein